MVSPQIYPPKPCMHLSFPHTCYMPYKLSLLNLISRMIFDEQYGPASSSLCSLLHSHVTSSLLDPYILLSTLISKTLSLNSSLNVSDQVSHPYKLNRIFLPRFECAGSKSLKGVMLFPPDSNRISGALYSGAGW